MRTDGTDAAIPCPIPGCPRLLAPGAPAQGVVLCAAHWAGLTNGMRHELLELVGAPPEPSRWPVLPPQS